MTNQEADWISLANDNAFITLGEVKKWLRIDTAYQLRRMIDFQAFPLPAYGASKSDRITATCRWRVGDIREWLKTGKRSDTFALIPKRVLEGIVQREKDRNLRNSIIDAGFKKSLRLREAEEKRTLK